MRKYMNIVEAAQTGDTLVCEGLWASLKRGVRDVASAAGSVASSSLLGKAMEVLADNADAKNMKIALKFSNGDKIIISSAAARALAVFARSADPRYVQIRDASHLFDMLIAEHKPEVYQPILDELGPHVK